MEETLAGYAASGRGLRKSGPHCWACALPERQEIDEALRKGTSIGVIRRWLIDIKGYDVAEVTRNRLTHHRDAHVLG